MIKILVSANIGLYQLISVKRPGIGIGYFFLYIGMDMIQPDHIVIGMIHSDNIGISMVVSVEPRSHKPILNL